MSSVFVVKIHSKTSALTAILSPMQKYLPPGNVKWSDAHEVLIVQGNNGKDTIRMRFGISVGGPSSVAFVSRARSLIQTLRTLNSKIFGFPLICYDYFLNQIFNIDRIK